jgi:rfaE bifunctional protein kinase chain/domain
VPPGDLSQDRSDLRRLVPKLAGRRVLIVGDLCLDEYLIGRAARLSREAPVPVLEFLRQFDVPGAAANPAINVGSLGGAAWVAGVVGADAAGHRLVELLAGLGVRTEGIVVDASRATTVKTRILAEVSPRYPQQMLRLDRQERRALDPAVRAELIGRVLAQLALVDAVLVSDYRSGVADPALVTALRQADPGIMTADSQGDLAKFAGFQAVKANHEETEAYLGCRLADDRDFARAARRLGRQLGLAAVLITRGRDGMSFSESGGSTIHIPAANVSEVFDVTGAGDTVIATYTLALTAGAPPHLAARLANQAAGLVVRRLGNAAPTPAELLAALEAGP